MALTGKVAVVSGASRGIGRAIAIRMAQEGARVVIDHPGDDDAAFETMSEIKKFGGEVISVQADVSSSTEVEFLFRKTLETYHTVDILVNNAGICPFVDWFEVTEDLWDRVHAINLKGTFLCSQYASKIMRDHHHGGRIISISSISALVGGGLQTHYTPTKAGIRSLMQSLAIVLGPYGITCNSILPGSILTDINREHYADKKIFERDVNRIPLGRLGNPDDIAGVAAFLASDDARYITGADILVDGGLFVNLQ
ncbi:SDR family NAD(P)-dependent oxidoreductase [Sulfobacillus thermosulfidooxidans]|uniref:SDR family NAD(P)-dependent oxidoreductase n=1 Tax=Sulfobacillus thermosulfidooxidans TaxID=28034 RepID=UPI0006B41E7F|nr:SDR family NAD(P)-dependent oxidoreductase [Sulfobacillus thermosulfidooxidans]